MPKILQNSSATLGYALLTENPGFSSTKRVQPAELYGIYKWGLFTSNKIECVVTLVDIIFKS